MCGFLVFESLVEDLEEINQSFEKINHRGPDDQHKAKGKDKGSFYFKRLSIMDLTIAGRQPFISEQGNILVCNGEVYNYLNLKKQLPDHHFTSQSDCEVLLPYYEKFGIKKLVENLDAEYAFVLYDQSQNSLIASRDPLGIRPLFYGKDSLGKLVFASEMKALLDLCQDIKPFPPGHYFDGKNIILYHDYGLVKTIPSSLIDLKNNINFLLKNAVLKRMNADANVGYLLSGGLDSSLVCAIAQKNSKNPIKTFSIGMEKDAIDSKYAQDVADFIGSDHCNVTMTKEEVLSSIAEVIYHLESWDITTIRASIGMYLVCKYIHQKTKIKVLMSGEVSDELFGYKYTDFAPNAEAFQQEAVKRVRELYMYDVLRADRCIAAHSLEARVPFSDHDFVNFVMSVDPVYKMNSTGMGKHLLRSSFEKDQLLPDHILWRQKAAFSDAVGHSMVDHLKAYAEEVISDTEYAKRFELFPYKTPISKESFYYRKIFEQFYPNQAELIIDYWLPNQSWENCNVTDPSARVLPNYGKSGV